MSTAELRPEKAKPAGPPEDALVESDEALKPP